MHCAAWTDVAETRKTDDGYTTRRARVCANGHRFFTFEVLGPIYSRSPETVRQTRVAAAVRAVQWARDSDIARLVAAGGMTHQAVADALGMSRQGVTKAIARVKGR